MIIPTGGQRVCEGVPGWALDANGGVDFCSMLDTYCRLSMLQAEEKHRFGHPGQLWALR